MIQINLIPDVKRELLEAKRQRAMVVSGAILASIAVTGIVVLMAIWTFGAQALLLSNGEKKVTELENELLAVEDIDESLTVQNQLRLISETHNNKTISSNLFASFTQLQVKDITISELGLSVEDGTISLTAESSGGFNAVERFIKTLRATQVEYSNQGEAMSVPLAGEVTEGDRSFGEDENNRKVIRFAVTFAYEPILLERGVENLRVVGPERSNATDSFEDIPKGLFKETSINETEGEL